MPVEKRDHTILLRGVISVEEAESLLCLLQEVQDPQLDLSGCEHLHAAALQVVLAARPKIASWPLDEGLKGWLARSLGEGEGGGG